MLELARIENPIRIDGLDVQYIEVLLIPQNYTFLMRCTFALGIMRAVAQERDHIFPFDTNYCVKAYNPFPITPVLRSRKACLGLRISCLPNPRFSPFLQPPSLHPLPLFQVSPGLTYCTKIWPSLFLHANLHPLPSRSSLCLQRRVVHRSKKCVGMGDPPVDIRHRILSGSGAEQRHDDLDRYWKPLLSPSVQFIGKGPRLRDHRIAAATFWMCWFK